MSDNTTTLENRYATDGKCHNSEPGTYGHECGEPAVWLGTKASGFQSGYCDRCKKHGYEAQLVRDWSLYDSAR